MYTFITYTGEPATRRVFTIANAQAGFAAARDEGADRVVVYNGRITSHYTRQGEVVNGSVWRLSHTTYGVPPTLVTQPAAVK